MEFFLLLIYKLHFIHELIFTNVLSLVLVCLLIDFESKIQNKAYNSLKTLFKTRKNKIKSFMFCFELMILSILIYNFISASSSEFSVEQNKGIQKYCSKYLQEESGLKNTFSNITFIFSMMGMFWGACFTIEHDPGKWWYQPLIIEDKEFSKIYSDEIITENNKCNSCEAILLVLKAIITTIVYVFLCICFRLIPYASFEFNFILNCVKYFIITFICTGVMPIIFGIIKMNQKKKEISTDDNNEIIDIDINLDDSNSGEENRNLFTPTLFVDYHEKGKYPFLHIK